MNTQRFQHFLDRAATYAPWGLFALAVGLRLLPGERLIDDAYITFRYTRNIVEGVGFVYNPGERVLGTTTPLYTWLMAGLSLLLRTQNFPAIAVAVNALADGLTCALLVPLGEAISGRRRVGFGAGALYAIAPYSVTFAIGGMETSVFVLLLCLTGLLYLRRQLAWAFSASLALLTRPDALIFIGPIGLDYALRQLAALRNNRSGPEVRLSFLNLLKPAIGFGLPLLPWLIFATLYFGTPIPHSIAAKTAAYYLQPSEGFVRLLQHYATPFFEQLSFPNGFILIAFLAVYLVFSLIGLLAAVRRDSRTLPFTLYPFLYFFTFALANPLIFRWYLTPPLPFYFLLILTGLAHLIQPKSAATPGQVTYRSRAAPYLFTTVCLFFAGLTARAWVSQPDHGPQRPTPDMAWFKLEALYTQVGRDLAPSVKPETVIAAGDIGALGYFSGARILDTLGLVSPQATPYYPLPPEQRVITYAISAQLIADEQPDYVVFLEVYGRRTLLVDPQFLADYSLREKIPTDIYGSDGMLVYEKKYLITNR